jgi:hypothetical protein
MDLAANSDCEKMNKSSAPIAPAQAEGTVAKPKRKPPRPSFARLDPRRDPTEQIAASIVQYLAAESDENGRVLYMVLYHNVHGERYRNWNGRDLWAEALKYLRGSIRREHGLIWLDCETNVVSSLPWPYKPEPKLKTRRRKPHTKWYNDVAGRAEISGLSISEQIAADRQTVSLVRAIEIVSQQQIS